MVAGTPCQREMGTLGWLRSEKRDKQVECTNLGDREIEPRSGTWNMAVLGTRRCMDFFALYLLLNIKVLKCCHFC